jgi:mannose-6-phosphate isomerase-like protein (cupin superfamily)
VNDADGAVSLHIVEISEDARTHYHKRLTEIYYILEGEGEMELDGERHAVQPGDAILIKPGCRHRAIGKLRVLNVPVPMFDPADEWFD